MQVHTLGKGAVITLEPDEQFRLSPESEDSAFYATRVQTVTAFAGKEPYFTVAGQQIHAPLSVKDPFWEMPVRFPDAGVLPPHVRAVVEKIVPVQDRRATAGKEQVIVERRTDYEFAPRDVQELVVEQIRADEEAAVKTRVVASPNPVGHPAGPLGAVDSSKTWAERVAERGRRSSLGGAAVDSPILRSQGESARQAAIQFFPPHPVAELPQVRESR